MTKKTTKTSTNGGMFSPKESIKSIGSSRRSNGKKSSVYNSRSNSKNSPRVFGQSPGGSMQSPISRGLASARKLASDKKSPSARVVVPLHNNYF